MVAIKWEKVNTWRLAQQHLLNPAETLLDVMGQLCAVQAQVMSAAELALGVRVRGASPSDIQNALWRDRSLVKTWALRGTLHLLAARDFPLMVAALSTHKHFLRESWLRYFGVTHGQMLSLLDGIRGILTDSGITREQLAALIAQHIGEPKLRESLLSGWGTLLKPAAYQGSLCFGPSEGQHVTFVSPKYWLGDWEPVQADEAFQEIARRFLKTYGPATSDEFARWFGMTTSQAKKIFKGLGDEITQVDVAGWRAWMLVSALDTMEAMQPASVVRLLPHFDQYTIAVARHSQYLLEDAFRDRVYRQQGWISPVVLVDGRIEGVWELDKQRASQVVSVSMFAPPTAAVKQGIEAEVKRLSTFLDKDSQLNFV